MTIQPLTRSSALPVQFQPDTDHRQAVKNEKRENSARFVDHSPSGRILQALVDGGVVNASSILRQGWGCHPLPLILFFGSTPIIFLWMSNC